MYGLQSQSFFIVLTELGLGTPGPTRLADPRASRSQRSEGTGGGQTVARRQNFLKVGGWIGVPSTLACCECGLVDAFASWVFGTRTHSSGSVRSLAQCVPTQGVFIIYGGRESSHRQAHAHAHASLGAPGDSAHGTHTGRSECYTFDRSPLH